MNDQPSCPCCGRAVADLPAVLEKIRAVLAEFGVDPGPADAIADILDVSPPSPRPDAGTYAELLADLERGRTKPSQLGGSADADEGPQWWVPSLIKLAYDLSERADARDALQEFARRRNRFSYVVVEELTDLVVIGMSARAWPIVDGASRPRFDISNDPIELEIRIEELQAFLSDQRARWRDLGLVPAALVDRPVQIGDTFAAVVSAASTTAPPTALVLGTRGAPSKLFPSSGEGMWRSIRGVGSVPVVDITWDARELGKLAYFAAAAGVVDTRVSDADAAMAADADTRYLAKLGEKVREQNR